jgi:hypothetical protein
MTYAVDIDNTICITICGDYPNAKPITERINLVNNLYKKGHTIIYWTARGSESKIDWSDLTRQQLELWGCLYHSVVMGKLSYDLLIDDKAINSEVFFK